MDYRCPVKKSSQPQHAARRQKSENENEVYWKRTPSLFRYIISTPVILLLSYKTWLMHTPWADLQQQKSAYTVLMTGYLFAGLPAADFHTQTPAWMIRQKKEDVHFFSVILHTTSAGDMCSVHVYFLFPLSGDFWTWNSINPKDDMAICIIFTRSSQVSVLEKTVFLSLYSERSIREKEGHILCRRKPRICRNSLLWL